MSEPTLADPAVVAARIAEASALLEAVHADRGLLAHVSEQDRVRLLRAAGEVARPLKEQRKRLARQLDKQRKQRARDADEQILSRTGIRRGRAEQVYLTPPLLPELPRLGEAFDEDHEPGPELSEARNCYICKEDFRRVHPFYDSLCGSCGDFNYGKRTQRADLSGRVALITGARVKIGYQAAIQMLRGGAHVIVLTRFPHDAARRYAAEQDFAEWGHRLELHGVDLRHTPSVEAFCERVKRRHSRLDFLINNACQTVRRPPGFYGHLMEGEAQRLGSLPVEARDLVAADPPGGIVIPAHRTLPASAAMSQLELCEGDDDRGLQIFPAGALDQDLQQVDLREVNSWRLMLDEVSSVELIEVQLVNAVAPYVLNGRLRPLLAAVPTSDAHIVNVSAVEGQFYRNFKTARHPHTNMAKAALNMMTRTAARDYLTDGIHMNSVDTGWVTDEDPAKHAERKRSEHRFHPPLDIVDGAARIIDPILHGLNSGEHRWGQFLKDYAPAPW